MLRAAERPIGSERTLVFYSPKFFYAELMLKKEISSVKKVSFEIGSESKLQVRDLFGGNEVDL
ncbi:hypothetical protein LEP1GSC193_1472 [Leptospira alstonii serovar Pingchang str. 80-412]|uniref:Uncharacterized protein n=2 Tax=Leptospira alstonii TaxID=28452 RepID=M6CU01_9LEPT|nr:hypothetical protein LEP1GSC194_1498 [Leptospira alstonii serovar Sichuan str. 79601]EQA81853.1 hypothetical protein LEP1GSC193_1472 [Leptospira alstonii serovar Pingchang str. 80-412]